MRSLGGGRMMTDGLPVGALVIEHGDYGWELRRVTSRDGSYDVEAVATPRFRDVLEAGRIERIRSKLASPVPADLRDDPAFWPQRRRG